MTEPVSLQELKEFLRINSGSFSDNFTAVQSIVPGNHATTTLYGLIGAYVDVLGLSAVVILDSGNNGAGPPAGTVDVKIQESDDHTTWDDWTGGALTQDKTANANARYATEATGTKQYIRVVAKVLLAACEFGCQIVKYSSDVTEDALLTSLIVSARSYAEAMTRRQLITATQNMYLDAFPVGREIKLPYGNLQSATMKYKDSDGVEVIMTITTDYLVDIISEPGRIVLPTDVSWPSFTPYPVNPITIEFVCGYGVAGTDVPDAIRIAIKMIASGLYENREDQGTQQLFRNKTAENLLAPYRLWDF